MKWLRHAKGRESREGKWRIKKLCSECLWATENSELHWCEWSRKMLRPTDLYSGAMWMFSIFSPLLFELKSEWFQCNCLQLCSLAHKNLLQTSFRRTLLLWAWMLSSFCFWSTVCVSTSVFLSSLNSFKLQSLFFYFLLPPPNTSVTTSCLVQPGSQRLISAIFCAQEIRGPPQGCRKWTEESAVMLPAVFLTVV